MKKAIRAKKKAPTRTRPRRRINAALEAIAQGAESHYNQSDGRVIARNLGVLQFALQAQEDHLQGLYASAAEVKARMARTKAKIAGLTNVLAKR